MRALAVVAGLLIIVATALPVEAADIATPVLSVTESSGELADAFAVSPDGTRLAYVQLAPAAGGRRVGTLKVVEIPSGTEQASVTGVPIPQTVTWVGADRIVVMEAVGKRQRVWSIPTAGPAPAAGIGPFDHAAVRELAGVPSIVAYTRTTRQHDVNHQVASFSPLDLHPLRNVTLTEVNGRIDHPDGKLRPLWWSDGWSVLVGRRPGAYDPVKDIRLPEQLVRLDALAGTVVVEPLGVDGFARITAEHRVRQGDNAFVFFRDGKIKLVAGGSMRTIDLARRAGDYYRGSIHDQPTVAGKLLFSATSRRKAKDPDGVELYTVALSAGDPTQVLVVPGLQKFVSWQAAGGRIGVLHKRQGRTRGPSIDVYDLAIH